MNYVLFLLYNGIVVPLIIVLSRVAAIFNHKVASGLKGRQNLFSDLENQVSKLNKNYPLIWIHVASMGEFEQAKPVIRQLRKEFAHINILLSFFSPSGLVNSHNFKEADIICYLPVDSYRRTKKFITLINPALVLIVRHDIWPNYQYHLKRMDIPVLLIDGSITDKRMKNIRFMKPFYRFLYAKFSEIITVSEENSRRMKMFFPKKENVHAWGDTRYDQVYFRCLETDKIKNVLNSNYFSRDRCFVAGSTWPTDEKVLLPVLVKYIKKYGDFMTIIAPHETTPQHIKGIETFLKNKDISFVRYSELEAVSNWSFRVLIMDKIGLLANLYALCRLAFVGGAFGPGVHNVLEPAAHGCAVLFGPRNSNSVEAQALKSSKGGVAIYKLEDFEGILNNFITNVSQIQEMGNCARQFVMENIGASKKIVGIVRAYLENREVEEI